VVQASIFNQEVEIRKSFKIKEFHLQKTVTLLVLVFFVMVLLVLLLGIRLVVWLGGFPRTCR